MNNQKNRVMAAVQKIFGKLLTFGRISLESLFRVLFIAGLIFPLAGAIALGNWAYGAAIVMREVSEGVSVGAHSPALGILAGLASFALGTVLWRVVCELLFIVFRRIQR